MYSVPLHVKRGKQPEVSHEVDSQENGKRVEVDRSDEDNMKSECAVCPYKLKEEKSLK